MDPRIAAIEKEYMRTDLPSFSPGDTVRVRVRVREGQKERIQPFEGICIAKRGAGVNATFTLRRVSGGVGVERIFPIHSPWIAGVEIVRRGDVRRAKLYYLRSRIGKRARVRERKWWLDKPSDMDTMVPGASDPVEAAEEIAAEGVEEAAEKSGGIAAAVAGAVDSVKEAASDVAEKAGDVVEAVSDKVEDVAEAAGEMVHDAVDKAKDAVEDVVDAVKGDDDDDEESSSEE